MSKSTGPMGSSWGKRLAQATVLAGALKGDSLHNDMEKYSLEAAEYGVEAPQKHLGRIPYQMDVRRAQVYELSRQRGAEIAEMMLRGAGVERYLGHRTEFMEHFEYFLDHHRIRYDLNDAWQAASEVVKADAKQRLQIAQEARRTGHVDRDSVRRAVLLLALINPDHGVMFAVRSGDGALILEAMHQYSSGSLLETTFGSAWSELLPLNNDDPNAEQVCERNLELVWDHLSDQERRTIEGYLRNCLSTLERQADEAVRVASERHAQPKDESPFLTQTKQRLSAARRLLKKFFS